MNIIRSIPYIDYTSPCFNCINETDVLLGAITPFLGFTIILLRSSFIKSIKYVIDVFDVFFVISIFTLFLTSIYATDFVESLDYSLRFLFLGSPFFYVPKILIINSNNYEGYLKSLLIYSFLLAVALGVFGGFLYLFKGYGHGAYRLTLPGVHPIPFSQLIGLGIITSFIMFITNGRFFNIQSKFKLNFNKVILPLLVLLLLATQTRGVMLSVTISFMLYLVLAKVKIKRSVIYASAAFMVLALIVAIQYIDFEVLFERLLAKQTEKSVDDRFIAYSDSIAIFLDHPFGIGPDAFKYYSILPYPHNLFLEFLGQYGLFGLVMSLYLVFLIVYMYFITYKLRRFNLIYIILLALFFYYFIEAMFSFTLWMHKGMFLTLGLFAGYHYKLRKQKELIDIK
ncbi:O-antigen ligase family protein [Seonamhaeicola sp. MEBiC1930]|uniref:O-antigen ligase family protein n=1 Tax=Seonamhaeicola sp. MEBiC01930 TaxID=2976768 RepID=UPI00324BC1F3